MKTYKYINENEKFWKNSYNVVLSEFSDSLCINADNEGDAIDYAEEKGWKGLFLDDSDITELESEGFLEDHISGGNHGLYLSSLNVSITQLD